MTIKAIANNDTNNAAPAGPYYQTEEANGSTVRFNTFLGSRMVDSVSYKLPHPTITHPEIFENVYGGYAVREGIDLPPLV